MECNRDEAERAKEIAEKKFKMKDIAGAKKFALKAQSLYPTLEGVSQMLATLDVYIAAAERKVNQEVNWYEILDASPRDNNETLKRKYRKLALMLHPDKNSFEGAEGAFKHVSEAWKFLSDKGKRGAYDRRMSLQTMYQKVSVSSSNSGFCDVSRTSFTSNVKPQPTQKKNPQKPVVGRGVKGHHTTAPSSFAASSGSNTFWTVCRRCMLQYEYLRTYVNCNLLCPDCLESFSAVETPKPGMSSSWKRNHNATSGLFSNSKWTFSRTSSVAQAKSVVQQAYEKVKNDREKAEATALLRAKKNAKRKSTTTTTDCSLKKRKVIGETETGCSNGRKVTYYVTGEIGRNIGKLLVTKERAVKLSPRMQKKKPRLHSESVELVI